MKIFITILLAISIVILIGCSSENTSTDLPLLPSGKHVSFITGFNATHPAITDDAINAKWAEAIFSSMKVGRIQTDWLELEPQPNQLCGLTV